MLDCPISSFVADTCEVVLGVQCPASELMDAYRAWAAGRGMIEPRDRDIAVLLENHGFARRRTKDARYWVGLRLRSSPSSS